MKDTLRWEILRTGEFTRPNKDGEDEKVVVTEKDIDELYATHDPSYFRPPVVLGHPSHDSPAYGRATKLERADNSEGGKSLFAHVTGVPAKLREAIGNGAYDSVSVRMGRYRNFRNSGKQALRHIGLQGAAVAVVKGMEPLTFSEFVEGLGCASFAEGGYEDLDLTAIVPCDINSMFDSGKEPVKKPPEGKENIMADAMKLDDETKTGLIDGIKSAVLEGMKAIMPEKPKEETQLSEKNKEPDPRDVKIAALEAEKHLTAAKETADKMFAEGKIFKPMIESTVVALNGMETPEKMKDFAEKQPALDKELFKKVTEEKGGNDDKKASAEKIFSETPEIQDSIQFLIQNGAKPDEAKARVRADFDTMFAEGAFQPEQPKA